MTPQHPLLPLDVDELLTTTRAVRRRLDFDRPVARSVVEECLRLAFQAPNGANGQDWHWILADNPALRHNMAEIYRAGLRDHALRDTTDEVATPVSPRTAESVLYLAENLDRVPVILVPTIGRRYGSITTFQQASQWGSVLPAVWSFMLALRSRGLGSAWTTLHLYREEEMAALLDIPEGHKQVGMFPVAYTIGTDFAPADRSASAATVGWNRFPR